MLRASSTHVTPTNHLPPETVLPDSEFRSVKENFLPDFLILRPAWFVGGDKPAKGKMSTKVGEQVYTYVVRRSEVARFVTEECLPGQDKWKGRFPVIGY